MRHLLLSVASVFISACMLSPVDGQVVSSTTGSIGFGGYTHQASQAVVLQYAAGSTWINAGSTTTSATVSYTTSDGVDLYAWNLPMVLPASAWTPGTTGSFAKVRMRVPGAGANGSDATMYTFRSDWSSCYASNPTLGGFINNCQSPRSPLAFVYTRDFPSGVDLAITSMVSTSSGHTEVRIWNNGRPGVLGVVGCTGYIASAVITLDEPILPGETRNILSSVPPVGRVICEVVGSNEDGSAEANRSNNHFTRLF